MQNGMRGVTARVGICGLGVLYRSVLLQTSLFNYGMVHLTMVGYSFVYNGIAELLA